MSKKYKVLILFISVLVFVFIGYTSVNSLTKKKDKLVIEYYYFNPCSSCTSGEEFKARLEEDIDDIIDIDEYEIQINNTANEESNKKHENIIKDIDMIESDGATLPMIKIEENYIFGVESIEKNTKDIIDKVKNNKI